MADFANMINENNTCSHMSSQSLSDVAVNLIDTENPELGLTLKFTGGNKCNATAYYALLVQLNCDAYATQTSVQLDLDSIATSECSPRVIMSSQSACPVLALGTLWQFFNQYYYIFGLAMMATGGFLLVLGGRMFKVTMFIAGEVSVASFIMIVMFAAVYPNNSPMWVVWLTLMVSTGMGAGIGYAAQKWARIGVFLIGYWIGGFMGAIMYSMFSNLFTGSPVVALWLFVSLTGALIAALSMFYFDLAVIFGSAIGGAYAFVRVSLPSHPLLGHLRVRRRFPQRVLDCAAVLQ